MDFKFKGTELFFVCFICIYMYLYILVLFKTIKEKVSRIFLDKISYSDHVMVIIKDKLKIKIVENNNEVRSICEYFLFYYYIKMFIFQVLPILIRDIGENLKPGEDVALVRFDTYADFLTPKDIQADEIATLDHLVKYEKKLYVLLNNIFFLVQSIINVGYFQLFIEDI